MEYSDLKSAIGLDAADRLEDAVLKALAQAKTPEAEAALSRMLACLTAAVAHRAGAASGAADQCVSDLENALHLLRTGLARAC